MSVDFFGVSAEKQRTTEYTQGLTQKEIDELIIAHKFLNISALKKISKLDLSKLDDLDKVDVNKLVFFSKNTIDVRSELDTFEKGFEEKRSDKIEEIIFDSKNNDEKFEDRFKNYFIKNTFLSDYIRASFRYVYEKM